MRRTHQNDQAGMVAIIITMIMIFVITLIVLGFAEVTRRNQREALDTQLASQAYYAAETGVNDVVSYIRHTGPIGSPNTGCSNGTVLPRDLRTDHSVATTCIMVDPNPNSLVVDTINPSTDNVVWDVKNSSDAAFSTLTFKWSPDPSSSGACGSGATTYPKPTAWNCQYGLLRVDLVPAGTPLDAVSLTNANKTFYLKPGSANTSNPLTLGGAAAYQVGCRPGNPNPGLCTVNINVSGSEYYMRLTSQYATVKNLVLTATQATGPAKFSNGQIVVDSTGRAQDQVKRIRVRIPLGQSSSLPVFGLQSATTICKNLGVGITTPANPSPLYDKQACSSIW
ncbi:MAG TPA: pilus assembly PilX N-terminal domain-containing protein [Candidatus Microsaccharimonas sp.]|nr:pilus assembly PilX N-terminal domain-containing protein [Candidatus Microsaccharimonas sp.]